MALGANLADISNGALRELLGTRGVSRSLVNLQNGTATFDSVTEPDAIIRFDIDGVACTTADVTNKALATLAALQNPVTGLDGYYTQPAGKTVYYVWVVNAAGTSYVIQGTYNGQVLGGGTAITLGDGSIPKIAVPGTYAPLAIFKVVTAAGTFIPGTTFWDSANLTAASCGSCPVSVLPSATPAAASFVAGGA